MIPSAHPIQAGSLARSGIAEVTLKRSPRPSRHRLQRCHRDSRPARRCTHWSAERGRIRLVGGTLSGDGARETTVEMRRVPYHPSGDVPGTGTWSGCVIGGWSDAASPRPDSHLLSRRVEARFVHEPTEMRESPQSSARERTESHKTQSARAPGYRALLGTTRAVCPRGSRTGRRHFDHERARGLPWVDTQVHEEVRALRAPSSQRRTRRRAASSPWR